MEAAFGELLRLLNGGWAAQAVEAATELGIPDLLAGGIGRSDDLARATACHEPSLRRLLRALASLGLCEEREDGSFGPTALGALLEERAPISLKGMALYGRYKRPVWDRLATSVRTGDCANAAVHGAAVFEHLDRDAAAAGIFDRAMAETTRVVAQAVVAACDFSSCKRVIDVGGGYGELLAAIVRASPAVHGTLVERPRALEGARRNLERAGVLRRCELVASDFFESVPGGGDCYLLKRVLHDWDDAHAAAILRCCRRAMPAHARLLVVEQILPDRMTASLAHQEAARMDLHMLLMAGGQERTESEYRWLLESAGLRLHQIVPGALNVSVIEALPA
jgi:ubiquinone/menaquinone biosynthesis C-methylase UbiE